MISIIVIIPVVTINSLNIKFFCHFSKTMFDNDIADAPNKKVMIGTGKSKKIPNNAKVGARHTTHKFSNDNIKPPDVAVKVVNFSFFNLIFRRVVIILIDRKIIINKVGINKIQIGLNNSIQKYLPSFSLTFINLLQQFFTVLKNGFFSILSSGKSHIIIKSEINTKITAIPVQIQIDIFI